MGITFLMDWLWRQEEIFMGIHQCNAWLLSTSDTPRHIGSSLPHWEYCPSQDREANEMAEPLWVTGWGNFSFESFPRLPWTALTLTGLVGEETTSFGPNPSHSRAGWPLPWPAVRPTGLEGCWSEELSAGAAWVVPSCCTSGVSWGSSWCLWPPLGVPEGTWAGNSVGPSKRRCAARLWRDSGVWSMVAVSVSWLVPLLGTEFTWALLNSDNTLEVFKQTNLCDKLVARMSTATGAVVRIESCWLF